MRLILFQIPTQDIIGLVFWAIVLGGFMFAGNRLVQRNRRLEAGLNLDEKGDPILQPEPAMVERLEDVADS